MADTLRKRFWQWLPVLLVFCLLLVSLSLLNMLTQSPDKATRYDQLHLYLSSGILVFLVIVLLVNLGRVLYQWRAREAGSRFTVRLMTGFLVLTLLPVLFVSLFSINLLGPRMDRWLSAPVTRALNDSVELSDLALKTRSQGYLRALSYISGLMEGRELYEMPALLKEIRTLGATEVMLVDSSLRIVAVSMEGTENLIPTIPERDIFREAQVNGWHTGLEVVGDNEIFSRVAVPVSYGASNTRQGVLTARFPVPERERVLADSVISVRNDYSSMEYRKEEIRGVFRISIFVVMVLTVLFAIWAAFVFSRRLTRPVRTLVEGTLAVAAGDLDKKLPVSERDDFSLLASSFNTMTRRLSEARREREQARSQLQQEHDYLDVVLEHLSSGVITLDENGIIRRVNTTAGNILQHSLQQYVGSTLEELGEQEPDLQHFLLEIRNRLAEGGEWQAEIAQNSAKGRLILVCRGAALPAQLSAQQGYVLVFDDITDLIQAEHDAAWGEVARRLAHEIKNPLTPIQLSAERLARKLSEQLNDESADFLKRMTNTIVHQVDNLKSMVNAFSEYARAPNLHLQPTDLNILVREVVELYRMNEAGVEVAWQLEDGLPLLSLDVNRIRQLLVNLIKNAIEALEENGVSSGKVTLLTSTSDAGRVILEVRDTGNGIPEELLPRLFEPYVTSKHKGTGLGLAIVKKIVEEHAGYISARNHEEGGAIITIKFPLN